MNPNLVRTPAVSAFVELPPERYRELHPPVAVEQPHLHTPHRRVIASDNRDWEMGQSSPQQESEDFRQMCCGFLEHRSINFFARA